MFKLIFVYPFILMVCIWLTSDVVISSSIYNTEDNHLSLQFPKASFRGEGTEPWFEFNWNTPSSSNELIDL